MPSLTGIRPSTASPVSQTSPDTVTFTNSKGEVGKYYFQNNPWKISAHSSTQKNFRYCIICGDERFATEEWSKMLNRMWNPPPIICKKDACWNALAYIPKFVPRKHYIVETQLDKSRAVEAVKQEFFEEIGQGKPSKL